MERTQSCEGAAGSAGIPLACVTCLDLPDTVCGKGLTQWCLLLWHAFRSSCSIAWIRTVAEPELLAHLFMPLPWQVDDAEGECVLSENDFGRHGAVLLAVFDRVGHGVTIHVHEEPRVQLDHR